MTTEELENKWLKRKTIGVEKKGLEIEDVLKKYTKEPEVRSFDTPDPASPGFLTIMLREPIELGKTLAMTPGFIKQFEEQQNQKSEILHALTTRYQQGEIDIDTFKRTTMPFMDVTEIPAGITKTTEQIIGDILGTLLWITPVREIKALKGLTVLSRFKRGAVLGGSFAGAYGMSENAEPDELLTRIGIGAAFGGPLEVSAPVIFKGIVKPFQIAGNILKKGVEKTYPIWEKLAPVYYRLEKLGPTGKKIADSLFAMDEQTLLKTGNRVANVKKAGLFEISQSESYLIGDLLEGRIQKKGVSKGTYSLFQSIRKVLDEIKDEAVKKVPNFEAKKNFAPHIIYDINVLGKEGGRVREEVLGNAVRAGKFKTIDAAKVALDSWIEFIRTGGREGKYWLRYLVNTKQAPNINAATTLTNEFLEAVGLKTRFGTGVKFARYGHLEFKRVLDFPFYDPDIRRTIPLYIMGATNRLEQITSLGATGEKFNRIVGALKVELQKEGRIADVTKLKRLIDTLFPVIQQADDKVKLSLFLRALNVPKLAFAQILNIGQSINTLLATDLPSLSQGLKAAFTEKGQLRALRSGATLDSVLREMRHVVGGESEFTNWFLKKTGFTWTEKFNRTVAANAGINYALHLQKQLIRNPLSKEVADRLIELRISPTEALKRELTEQELLIAGQLISNITQFRARPLDLPRFASSPEGKVIFQFKNFVYNQTLFLKKMVVDEFAHRNIGRGGRALFILATVFPMTGEVLGDVRSLLTGSTRPTKYLDRYIENIAMVGGIGIFMDALQSLQYGRFADFLAGPTAGMFTGIMERLYNISTTGKITDADLRFLGQQGGVTRFLTSYLFPADNPNRKTILEQIKEEW